MLAAVIDHLGAAWERLAEDLHAPWGNDFKLWRECGIAELEAHLVVTLTRGTVRDSIRAFALSDLDVGLGNQRPCNRSAEHILPFIDRIGAHHREDEVAGELFDQVDGIVRRRAGGLGFFSQTIEFFLLADVSRVSNDFSVIVLLEPANENGSVQTP